MQKYVNYVISDAGRALPDVSVRVNDAGTSTAATIFSDNSSTALANPFTNEADGSFYFYAANGRYDVEFTLTGYSFDDDDTADILLFDNAGSALTLGSVIFAGTGGIFTEDNTNFFYNDATNQLRLAATGSAAGLLIGGDTLWYRSAANVMRTPDALTVDGVSTLTGAVTTGAALSVTTTLTVTGAATFNGAVTLGDASGDTINIIGDMTLTGSIASVMNFTGDNARDIGQIATGRPRDLFLGRNATIGGTLSVTGAVTFSTTITVPQGGTGVTSLIDGGIMLGSGTGGVTVLAQATNGQIPIGSTGADPVLAVITGTSLEVDITNGAGTIQIGLPAIVTITTSLTVTGVGGHSFGGAIVGNVRNNFVGAFTSDGTDVVTVGVNIGGTLTMASGDTIGAGLLLGPSTTTTQGSSQTIDVIAHIYCNRPNAVIGTGDTLLAVANVYLQDMGSVALNNYNLLIDSREDGANAVVVTRALTDMMAIRITPATVTATSARVIVNVACLYIQDAFDTSDGDITVTNGPYSIFVDAGECRLDGLVTIGGALVVSTTAACAIGGAAVANTHLILRGTFTSDGSGNTAAMFAIQDALTGFAGDTALMAGAWIHSTFTTQATVEAIAVVAQLYLNAATITIGTATVTLGSTLYIAGPSTNAVTNLSLKVDLGDTELDGNVTIGGTLTVTGTVTIVQTDSTADATLSADTVTSIAAAVPSAIGDLVATEGTGWGSSTEAGFDSIATALDNLITHSTEIDLDLEALIVDVRDLKSAFNSLVDGLQAQGLVG